ncbi:MAG: hypothetical protein COB42_01395 [Sulfurimonas sp.]|nr:MAG: hypothetical protein COB42_01395 [Sulfurimonas sp.]
MKYKSLLISLATIVFILAVIAYGFYEKDRKEQLYKDFKSNKKIICDDVIVQKSKGWSIRNNRFFTNGKVMKTIIFCKSAT